jgi:hypothetical protein
MSILQIEQQADFFNVTVDGIMFTADKCDREWLIGYGENNGRDTERAAESIGMTTDEFWAHYQPLLDNAVGW